MSFPVTVHVMEDSRNDGHVRARVFIGRNAGSRGKSGELVMRTDEWDELRGDLERALGHRFEVTQCHVDAASTTT
jgi:hypothetical protein